MKQCAKCKKTKPESGFTPNRYGKDGRHHICKTCRAKYQRRRKEKLARENKCVICTKYKHDSSGTLMCDSCTMNNRKAMAEYRKMRMNADGSLDRYSNLSADELGSLIATTKDQLRIMKFAFGNMVKGELE